MTEMRIQMRSLSLPVLAGILFAAACVTTVHAQQTAPDVRIAGPIDNTELVTLKGNVLPAANAKNDRGPVSASLPMPGLVLVLSRSPEQQAAFDAYVQNEYDSSSPDFHQWLTPDEIGNRFGPSLTDIATVSNWLSSQGFAVTGASKDRMTITFSGTAGQVQTAFHTSIHNLSVNGVAHLANMTNPEIPAALAPVVVGIKQLHDFHPHPLHRVGSLVQFNQELGGWQRTGTPVGGSAVLSPLALGSPTPGSTALNATASTSASGTQAARPRPLFTSTSDGFVEDDVTPNDFATIYNVQPLWSSNITGAGQKIVIVGTSDINLSDVSAYKTTFGLPAGSAPIVQKGVNGYDPGVCTSTSSTASCTIGDLEENTLDVEVSGGVATGAQVVLVTSGYNNANANLATNDAIYDSAKWIEDNVTVASSSVYGAHSMSVSYGLCELDEGTSGNVSYYNLWQTAAAEGLAVFTATGDAGSPACDQGQDSYGVPYAAQYGLGVSGVASTPFNTAVGGTDFSWCKPTIIQSGSNQGNATGCAATNASPYWNASNATNLSSAKGYVPEVPWNDACENPIWAAYLESVATYLGTSGVSTPEEACSYAEQNWYSVYENNNAVIAGYVDTVGTGGGQSNCVVNSTTGSTQGTCNSSATSVTTANGSVTLSHDGWALPSWQTGVAGTSGLTARAVPDVSFFSGDGGLDSATLICLAAASSGESCTAGNASTTALEIGGTSVASPEMAGVMALIDQKWGNQGLPNKQLYQLAAMQTYSSCSAESVTTSSSCYFQSIDQGTSAMPCNTGEVSEGGIIYEGNQQWSLTGTYSGAISPNCTAINSGDVVGTLISSGTTPAYNATAGYNMATGLGSLNVANVANNSSVWSLVGTAAATVTVQPASNSIKTNQSLSVTITVAGGSGQPTPTGKVTLSGNGYTSAATALTNGSATIVIPASSFTGTGNSFSVTLTASYTGDTTYAAATGTADVTVTKLAPTVTVTPAASATNSNVPFNVTVAVSGTGGTPTGTVTLTAGSYTSSATTLSNGTYKFTIPANTFVSSGPVALNVAYSGDTNYTTGSGSSSVAVTYVMVETPTVTVTPASNTVNSAQSLNVTVAVTGTNGIATETISLAGGGYNSAVETLANGAYTFTIPANSFTSYGSVTLTATYSGDGDYLGKTGTANITVTQSVYALTASTPAAVAPGATATSTITGQTSSSGYTGTVTLNSCTMTGSSVTGASSLPCTASGTITYAAGTATGSGTATVTTTGNVAMLDTMPGGKGWLRTGGGAMLAFLVFLGIPAKRRSWRGLLGMVVLLAALGGLSACGGGSINSGGGGSTGTPQGTYTFSVTATGNPAVTPVPTTTFSVTVN